MDHSSVETHGMKWMRRALWSIAGIIWFFWVGLEDRGIQMVVVVALGFAVPFGFQLFAAWHSFAIQNQIGWMIRSILPGAIAGIFVSPIAIILVLLKISLHQHDVPDFSGLDLQNLWQRTPFWLIAGVLFGAAGGVWGWYQKSLQ